MALSPAARVGNIGRGERRKRLVFGIVAFGVGAVIAVLLVVADAPLVWRLPLLLVFYVGALGVFQARDKT
jgi:MFS family permease